MSRIPQQLTMGVIIGNRRFFPSYLVAEAREQAIALFGRLGINTVMLDPSQTELGGVETRQDAKVCAELFRAHRDRIHGVVVLLPNFGDEKAVAETLRLSGLNVPVLVQAEEDNLDKMGLATRRDSFCGKISLCNNLRQYGIPFTLTSQHVCALTGEVFEQDLKRFEQVCRVVSSMRGVRVGAIGARPAGFNTVRYSEKLLERLGIAVETLDLSEVFTRIKTLRDDDIRVDEKRRIAQYCAEIIRPDDFIYLDAGTTTEMMIDFLTEKKASYVTNGIMHAKKLMDYGFRVYLIGGELRAVTEAVVGEEALESLRKYNFTKGFFGINGISKKSGFTTPDVNEALVKKTALSQCLDAYILADASKFGRISAVCGAGLDQAVIVTGKLKEPSFLKYTAIKEVSE